MRKSQEDEDIEKIFQKSRMTTEAPIVPIVKQEVDQEKPKELENTMVQICERVDRDPMLCSRNCRSYLQ